MYTSNRNINIPYFGVNDDIRSIINGLNPRGSIGIKPIFRKWPYESGRRVKGDINRRSVLHFINSLKKWGERIGEEYHKTNHS
jgi:hypothetical protein